MTEGLNVSVNELEDTQKGKFLTFMIGEEFYGIEILYVTEIVGLQPITVVPELPDFIKGIINLRGKIIPVMDARLRFKKEPKEYNERTCIIVINVKDSSIGVIVDEVSEVLIINDDDIVDPPNMASTGNGFIKNIGKSEEHVTLILDCDMLLNDSELKQIKTEEKV